MVKLKVWAKVGPTESKEKVSKALLSLFPKNLVSDDKNVLSIEIDHNELDYFREVMRIKKIEKTVFKQLLKFEKDDHTRLMFNKQAAFMGKFIVVDTYDLSPMGAIVLEIDGFNDDFLRWFTGLERDPESKFYHQSNP